MRQVVQLGFAHLVSCDVVDSDYFALDAAFCCVQDVRLHLDGLAVCRILRSRGLLGAFSDLRQEPLEASVWLENLGPSACEACATAMSLTQTGCFERVARGPVGNFD